MLYYILTLTNAKEIHLDSQQLVFGGDLLKSLANLALGMTAASHFTGSQHCVTAHGAGQGPRGQQATRIHWWPQTCFNCAINGSHPADLLGHLFFICFSRVYFFTETGLRKLERLLKILVFKVGNKVS